jgi:SAM-dependent methyltransferase
MDESEFDRFAAEYHDLHQRNIRLSGEDPVYFARYKALDASHYTGRELPRRTLMDFGTGVGNSIPHLHEQFPDCELVGVDVSKRSLEIAASRFGEIATFRAIDSNAIPVETGSIGLAFAACVFHHIPHDEHAHCLREIRRSLSDGGWLVLYEHNPLNPLTTRAVRDCPFDENAHLIRARVMKDRIIEAGFRDVAIHYRVFFPKALAWARPLERRIEWLPLGAQYCIVGRR